MKKVSSFTWLYSVGHNFEILLDEWFRVGDPPAVNNNFCGSKQIGRAAIKRTWFWLPCSRLFDNAKMCSSFFSIITNHVMCAKCFCGYNFSILLHTILTFFVADSIILYPIPIFIMLLQWLESLLFAAMWISYLVLYRLSIRFIHWTLRVQNLLLQL